MLYDVEYAFYKYRIPENDPVGLVVSETIDRLAEMSSWQEALPFFEELADKYEFAEEIPPSLRIGDYWFQYSFTFFQQLNFENLQRVKHLALACVPDPIAFIEYPNKECIIVNRVPGTDKSQIIPYKEADARIVTEENKRQLLADVAKLAKDVNFVFRNLLPECSDKWFVVPATGAIIIREYDRIIGYRDDAAKEAFLRKLKRELGLLD